MYDNWNTICRRFRRWAGRGVWERIFAQLAGVDGVPARLVAPIPHRSRCWRSMPCRHRQYLVADKGCIATFMATIASAAFITWWLQ